MNRREKLATECRDLITKLAALTLLPDSPQVTAMRGIAPKTPMRLNEPPKTVRLKRVPQPTSGPLAMPPTGTADGQVAKAVGRPARGRATGSTIRKLLRVFTRGRRIA